jgi:hypothetical protein
MALLSLAKAQKAGKKAAGVRQSPAVVGALAASRGPAGVRLVGAAKAARRTLRHRGANCAISDRDQRRAGGRQRMIGLVTVIDASVACRARPTEKRHGRSDLALGFPASRETAARIPALPQGAAPILSAGPRFIVIFARAASPGGSGHAAREGNRSLGAAGGNKADHMLGPRRQCWQSLR